MHHTSADVEIVMEREERAKKQVAATKSETKGGETEGEAVLDPAEYAARKAATVENAWTVNNFLMESLRASSLDRQSDFSAIVRAIFDFYCGIDGKPGHKGRLSLTDVDIMLRRKLRFSTSP